MVGDHNPDAGEGVRGRPGRHPRCLIWCDERHFRTPPSIHRPSRTFRIRPRNAKCPNRILFGFPPENESFCVPLAPDVKSRWVRPLPLQEAFPGASRTF
jgi:hypothetical protein